MFFIAFGNYQIKNFFKFKILMYKYKNVMIFEIYKIFTKNIKI